MEKIKMIRKSISKIQEVKLKQDFIVPDSKPDIFSILDGNFYIYFSKINLQSGILKSYGNIEAYLTYLSSEEETIGLKTIFNFDDVVEDISISEKMNLQYEIEINKKEIKIINERKITIMITLQIIYDFYKVEEFELFNDFNQIEGIQINSQKIKMNSFTGMGSNLASLKEEIKIESSDIISDILKVNTNISNKEVKISYHKVLTKADIEISLIYLTQDGRVRCVKEKFPMMSFIEMEEVNEEDFCNTEYQVRNIVLNWKNGEENSVTVQMEYEIFCKAFEEKELEIVKDVYSLKYDTEVIRKEIEISSNISTNLEEKVDIKEDIYLENASRVIDIFGKSKIIKEKEGEIELTIYFEKENKIGLNVKEVKIPFIFKSNSNDILTKLEQLEYDLNDNQVMIKGEIKVSQINSKTQVIQVVQNVTKKDVLQEKEDSMIVYSVKKSDTLWDISKKFRVNQENIIKSNELEEPYHLNFGEKIYIVK